MKTKTLPLICTICILFITLLPEATHGQTQAPKEIDSYHKPYHPEADAQADLDSILIIAQRENKNVILQAGGNWCIWCLRFNNYIHQNEAISKLLNDKFLYYHVNYSKENKNEAFFNKYAPDGPQLGFPFFIVLDKNGKVLKIRESGNLEQGKGYDQEKVLSFFNEWIRK